MRDIAVPQRIVVRASKRPPASTGCHYARAIWGGVGRCFVGVGRPRRCESIANSALPGAACVLARFRLSAVDRDGQLLLVEKPFRGGFAISRATRRSSARYLTRSIAAGEYQKVRYVSIPYDLPSYLTTVRTVCSPV